MFLDIFKYSGISTKTRVMMSKLLNNNDYRELINRKSVYEIAAYLKSNTIYSKRLQGINENTIHRGRLENILKQEMMEDYRKLFSFINGDAQIFLKTAFLKYEIESLKMLFRVLETEGNTRLVEESLLFLIKYNTLNIPRLAESKNSQEFILNLKGSQYYEVLRPFLVDEKNINLFRIEMMLDLFYLKTVLKVKKNKLSKHDSDIIEKSFGVEIDMFNIFWVYRCKKYYNIDDEIIYNSIIPHRYCLSKTIIDSLVKASDVEEVENIIATTKYASIFVKGDEQYYELNLSELMYKIHKRNLRRNNYTVACIISYIHLKEYEISNIISIIEGIRYGLELSKIQRFVVGFENADKDKENIY